MNRGSGRTFQRPLTLTLSRGEREQQAGMGERDECRSLSPRRGPVSLSPRERAGVRGFCMIRFMVHLRVQSRLVVEGPP